MMNFKRGSLGGAYRCSICHYDLALWRSPSCGLVELCCVTEGEIGRDVSDNFGLAKLCFGQIRGISSTRVVEKNNVYSSSVNFDENFIESVTFYPISIQCKPLDFQ